MTGIHIAVYANSGKFFQSVVDASEVGGLSVSALLHIQVGNQVGEGVWLNDGHNTDVREFWATKLERPSLRSWNRLTLDSSDDLVDVVFVVGLTIVSDAKLSVGSLGSAVTVGEIVDDDLDELLLAGGLLDGGRISELVAELRDLGDGICRTVSYVNVEEVPVFTHQTR